jgi:hypothetical protein
MDLSDTYEWQREIVSETNARGTASLHVRLTRHYDQDVYLMQ